MSRLTWHKERRQRVSAPEVYTLRASGSDDRDWLAKVQQVGSKWFWYGSGMNTRHAPDTLENCKAAATAHIKRIRAAAS